MIFKITAQRCRPFMLVIEADSNLLFTAMFDLDKNTNIESNHVKIGNKNTTRRLIIKSSKNSVRIAYAPPEKHFVDVTDRFLLPETETQNLKTRLGIFELEPLPPNGLVCCVLPNGELIQPNDFVLVNSPFPGEPFQIARIISFEKSRPCVSTNLYDSVRLNWYFRPRDIQRHLTDTRLLFASMHSDIYNIGSVQEKCTVKHRSQIENLDEYKSQAKSYYFDRLFDQNINKVFDVVPVTQVKNAPDDVLEDLFKNYDFIVTEYGKGRALLNEPSNCKVCKKWCAFDFSVQCADCKKYYHMDCVVPPLLKKPPHGFGWTCATCSFATQRKKSTFQKENANVDANHATENNLEGQATQKSVSILKGHNKALSNVSLQEDHGKRRNLKSLRSSRNLHQQSRKSLDENKPNSFSNVSKLKRLPWNMRYLDLKSDLTVEKKSDIYPSRARISISPMLPTSSEDNLHPLQPLTTADEEMDLDLKSDERFKVDIPTFFERWPFLKDLPLKGYLFPLCEPNLQSAMLLVPITYSDALLDDYLCSCWNLWKKLRLPVSAFVFLELTITALYETKLSPAAAFEKLKSWMPGFGDPKNCTGKRVDEHKINSLVKEFGVSLQCFVEKLKFEYSLKEIFFSFLSWASSPKGLNTFKKLSDSSLSTTTTDSHGLPTCCYDIGMYDLQKILKLKKTPICRWCHSKRSSEWFVAPPIEESSPKDKSKIVALCQRCGYVWRYYGYPLQQATPSDLRNCDFEPVKKRKADWDHLSNHDNEVKKENNRIRNASSLMENPRVSTKTFDNFTLTHDSTINVKADTVKRARQNNIKNKDDVNFSEDRKKCCALCGIVGTEGLLVCFKCGTCVHERCYVCDDYAENEQMLVSASHLSGRTTRNSASPGIVSGKKSYAKKDQVLSWACLSCRSNDNLGQNNDNHCVLCLQSASHSLMKKTVEGNWVHLICASWTPDVYVPAEESEPVCGIAQLPPNRWEKKCEVCGNSFGVCVSSPNSGLTSHVTCAEKANWYLGFEFVKQDQSPFSMLSNLKSLSFFGNVTEINTNKCMINSWTSLRPVLFGPSEQLPRNFLLRNDIVPNTNNSAWSEYIRNLYPKAYIYLLQYTIAVCKPTIAPTNVACCCSKCNSTMSPFWWPGNICQACHCLRVE